MIDKIRKTTQKPLVRNTLWMILSLGGRLVLQAIYFIIIARTLGPEQYGAFISVQALVAIISPFTSLGAPELLVKNVSRNPENFSIYLGNAFVVTSVLGAVGCLFLVLGSPFLLHESISVGLIILVSISDLFFEKFIATSRRSFQAFQRLSKTGLIDISLSAARLVAVITVVLFASQIDATEWGYFYLGSTVCAAFFALFLVLRELGTPKTDLARLRPEAAEGFFFSVSISGHNMYNQTDKVMLARLASLEVAGVYSVAYRIVEMTLVPVRAILEAAYAKFFQHGKDGIRSSYAFASRICPFAIAYGLFAAFMIFVFAPTVPFFLGEEYQGSVSILRWMAPLPLLKALYSFASDALSGAGLQGIRSFLIIVAASLNVSANLWLIPILSWKGAVLATLFSSSFLVIAFWLVVFIKCNSEKKTNACV